MGSALGLAGTGLQPRDTRAGLDTKAEFDATWDSLSRYVAPQWYRDAKFGIWAHWTAQCVPEQGDWYARNMYIQGEPQYEHHLRTYGHPSQVGFMEIDHQWKAEHWNPDELMALYAAAGAKYFVALANHHDNVDTYASSHHPWNTTRVGPKRDIIGTWEKLVRAKGLRFGVSNHSAHAWHWLQPAYGYDAEGSMKGKRYDAWNLTKAEGRGKWWHGLDPQQLYTGRTMAMPEGVRTLAEMNAIHERTDLLWSEGIPANNIEFARNWALRCRELIDVYQPDLLYFDDFDLPLQQYGLEIAAHYYNANIAWHGGQLEAVLNIKMVPPQRRMGIVEDVENGGKSSIEIYPWQTCTCLGNWHYDRELYDRNGYKTAPNVIHTLSDVVSKNGNLLLSVPMRSDGTIDDKVEAIVEEVAAWMGRYGSAIYDSRPWRIHGEGPTKSASGMFAFQGSETRFTATDVRYMRKGDAVHAVVLGWPEDNVVRLKLWSLDNPIGRGDIRRVTLPGEDTPLSFRRTESALEIDLPPGLRNRIGVALVLSGHGITSGSLGDYNGV